MSSISSLSTSYWPFLSVFMLLEHLALSGLDNRDKDGEVIFFLPSKAHRGTAGPFPPADPPPQIRGQINSTEINVCASKSGIEKCTWSRLLVCLKTLSEEHSAVAQIKCAHTRFVCFVLFCTLSCSHTHSAEQTSLPVFPAPACISHFLSLCRISSAVKSNKSSCIYECEKNHIEDTSYFIT